MKCKLIYYIINTHTQSLSLSLSLSLSHTSAYFVLSFVVPILFVWVPFTFEVYGPPGAWW